MRPSSLKFNSVKADDTLLADDGFTCLKAGPHEVHSGEKGLFINCAEGRHYLEGQEDEDGNLVGLTASCPAESA